MHRIANLHPAGCAGAGLGDRHATKESGHGGAARAFRKIDPRSIKRVGGLHRESEVGVGKVAIEREREVAGGGIELRERRLGGDGRIAAEGLLQ